MTKRRAPTDKALRKFAQCVNCGATGELEGDRVVWRFRDGERCRHPPITKCPDMNRAFIRATPKVSN
jgi:hypothetical protein